MISASVARKKSRKRSCTSLSARNCTVLSAQSMQCLMRPFSRVKSAREMAWSLVTASTWQKKYLNLSFEVRGLGRDQAVKQLN